VTLLGRRRRSLRREGGGGALRRADHGVLLRSWPCTGTIGAPMDRHQSAAETMLVVIVTIGTATPVIRSAFRPSVGRPRKASREGGKYGRFRGGVKGSRPILRVWPRLAERRTRSRPDLRNGPQEGVSVGGQGRWGRVGDRACVGDAATACLTPTLQRP
jgi:hypothetical protein